MVGCVRALCWAIAVAVTVGLGGTARAASWLELNFWLSGPDYSGRIPSCGYPAALDRISAQFADKESRFWNSHLKIVGFEHVRETAYRPWDRHLIPRRFCQAVVRISDGRREPVYYWLGENTGMIGAIWGVTWCIVGYDRNLAYNPRCKMARP